MEIKKPTSQAIVGQYQKVDDSESKASKTTSFSGISRNSDSFEHHSKSEEINQTTSRIEAERKAAITNLVASGVAAAASFGMAAAGAGSAVGAQNSAGNSLVAKMTEDQAAIRKAREQAAKNVKEDSSAEILGKEIEKESSELETAIRVASAAVTVATGGAGVAVAAAGAVGGIATAWTGVGAPVGGAVGAVGAGSVAGSAAGASDTNEASSDESKQTKSKATDTKENEDNLLKLRMQQHLRV